MPIAAAEVIVVGDASHRLKTSAAGTFSFVASSCAGATIAIRAIGYLPREIAVDSIRDAESLGGAVIHLNQAPVTLSSVTATASGAPKGFDDRRRGGRGTYFDSDEIAHLRAYETSDVLRHVVAVRAKPLGSGDASITVRGLDGRRCAPVLFVDGYLYMQNLVTITQQVLDAVVRPEQIAGLEVYDADMTPIEFRVSKAGRPWCGAIVIWRKKIPAAP